MSRSSRTRAEQETILRWDRATDAVSLYTASPYEAAKWRRRGYDTREEGGGWWATGARGCVTVRSAHQKPRGGQNPRALTGILPRSPLNPS